MRHGMTFIIVVKAPAGLEECQIGDVFASPLGTSGDTGKWMVPLDSAHQTGASILLREVLAVEEGVCRCRIKICEIGSYDNTYSPANHPPKMTSSSSSICPPNLPPGIAWELESLSSGI